MPYATQQAVDAIADALAAAELSLDPWTNVAGDRRVNEGKCPLSWDDRCS
jgi:hypothetical protein